MKKLKGMLTVVVMMMIALCMCSMVFGYAHTDYWLQGKTIREGRNYYSEEMFNVSQNENIAMQPYYTSIEENGSCEVGVYLVNGDVYTKYDSDTKSVSATTQAGYKSYSIYAQSGATNDYKAFIRCYDTRMYLQYLKVYHD